MQTNQGNFLVSLLAVQAFLDEHAARLPGIVNTGARQKLTSIVADLSTHASDRSGSALASQGSTKGQESLRIAMMRDQ